MQLTLHRGELSEIARLERERLNDALLSVFLAILEGTNVHDLVSAVHEEAETVRCELTTSLCDMLTPEYVVLELAALHGVVLFELRISDLFIIYEQLHVEVELLVLGLAVLHVGVGTGNLSLDFAKYVAVLLEGVRLGHSHRLGRHIKLPVPLVVVIVRSKRLLRSGQAL